MLMGCALAAVAMPAKPGWQTFVQSDGTSLQVQAVGNAFNHAILTTDGLMVARGANGDFYYNSSVTGLTAVRAHEQGQRSASETAFINAQRFSLTMATENRLMLPKSQNNKFRTVGGSNDDSGVPAHGERRIPIILVEYKDKKFNNTREQIIDAMLTGNESVGQYFRDQSNGLYEPNFEVYGIYCLSQNRSYYGGNSGGNDKALGAMVTEACQMAAADGMSFKPYDTNNDDYCDVVIVIYAGVGEAQASTTHPEAIWPCNWSLSAASYYGMGGNGAFRPNNGDPLVDNFAVFNELYGSNDNGTTIDGIGTFAHEFGHCLGLPDFYDTGNGNHYGLGDWDIMCMGCYNNDGFTPPGYSAYEKVFMGWIDYITAQPGTYYTLPVFNKKQASTDKAVRITSDLNQNEFFILENRRKQGWDRYAPGEGIMITHVTYSQDRWWGNTPNNQNIQLMTLMNADNTWSYYNESTDLWPQGNNNAFTDSSTPAAKLNMNANGGITGNAGFLGKPVTEMVINSDKTASFWFMKGAAVNPVISASTDNLDFGGVMTVDSKSLTFNVVGQALTGNVTVSLNDASGVFAVNPSVISASDAANAMPVTVTFTPAAIGDYNATVTLSSNGAQDVVVNLTGHGLIEGYTPVMLPANEQFVSLTGFRADWTDQTPDGNVASYTLEVKTKPTFDLLETADFSGVPDGLSADGQSLIDVSGDVQTYLPEGWSCTSPMYAYDGYLITDQSITTRTYDLRGYDKVTVDLTVSSYYQSYYGTAVIEVSTSMGSETLSLGSDFEVRTVVLDCADNDRITFRTTDKYMALKAVQVYAGERPDRLNATNDATYRLIPGITDMFCTVSDLEAAGTYVYKVKAVYIDGTESLWSNVEEVTLFDGHGYQPGDVNHDGAVTIGDVTALISKLMNGTDECEICSDVNIDGLVNIGDVTALIGMLINGN